VLITLVAGARPNFVKIAPLTRAFTAAGLDFRLVHTGQHYDERMSSSFFDELQIPRPDVNLEVGSGSHVYQLAEVMKRLEPELQANRPAALVVVGDVNSTAASAIAAVKMGIPVAHVEAGLRSFDRDMPEETNRILTDSISQWLFVSEPSGIANLRREGVPEEKIHFVGNVMIDTLLTQRERARSLRTPEKLELRPRDYSVLTLHRPSNVDNPDRLRAIVDALHRVSARVKILFVVHPRTQARLREFGVNGATGGFRYLEPLSYLNMLGLMDQARLVITDSGGMQEETTALGVPCLTLRENTERPVTIEAGTNTLVRGSTEEIVAAIETVLNGKGKPARRPEKWDGQAAPRIAAILRCDLATADGCPPAAAVA
jgi:UDP-N-acetylglucosamine 2-epimerase (non-hydrolysing)